MCEIEWSPKDIALLKKKKKKKENKNCITLYYTFQLVEGHRYV